MVILNIPKSRGLTISSVFQCLPSVVFLSFFIVKVFTSLVRFSPNFVYPHFLQLSPFFPFSSFLLPVRYPHSPSYFKFLPQ